MTNTVKASTINAGKASIFFTFIVIQAKEAES